MKFLRSVFSRLFDSLLRHIELAPTSDRIILRTLFFIILFSGAVLVYNINHEYSTETPVRGGTLHEGIIGAPRFVNPVLASTRADHDMTALLFSGLMKINPNGELVPNLAESVTVSEDGLTYNVVLRKDIYFHDETPVTVRDVLFTLRLIQNPDLKSPLRGNWTGVTFEEISDSELNIVLEEAYAPFIENFTVGILPAHLWSSLPIEQVPFSQLNTEPIGAGAFKLAEARRDQSGVIQSYVLEAHQDIPNPSDIETLEVVFFETEAAIIQGLADGTLDASAYISNESLGLTLEHDNITVIREPLPRVFAVFFNQNKSVVLRDDAVREALSLVVDREEIIQETLFTQGVPINGPIAGTLSALESSEDSNESTDDRVAQAKQILQDAGWLENNQGRLEKEIDGNTETLRITLKTSNAPLFVSISTLLKRYFEEIGVEVTIDQFEQSDLLQGVIRPRDFEALLFGLDMNRSYDLYPFWHSSQKDDPGLNIAQYTNLTVDDLLEESRVATSSDARTEYRIEAATTIANEHPAIFLFQPYTTYVVDKDFVIPSMIGLAKPSDRFSNMSEWYTDSDELWNVFRQ